MKDPALLKALHVEWRGECALVDAACVPWDCVPWFSLHHIHRHPRDDVRANLIMLCGDGTRGHHAAIEAHLPSACAALYAVLTATRPDTMRYLGMKLGGAEAALGWLHAHLYRPGRIAAASDSLVR